MTPEEYRQAIEQPAARAGTRIEPALADALVSQVLGAAGALPLLSTTLLELWENRSGSTISHQVLETTGGVRGAVARLAEGVYSDLDDGQRHLARGVFLRLAGPGEGLAVVKRRVPLEEFDPDHSPELAELLDLLAQRRLITIDDASVEVVHEALLREWPRYQEWLAEDAQGRVVQVHLATSAREWSERGRDSAELYRGARLSAASEWASRNDAQLNPVEREFLAASRAQHQAQVRRLRVLLAAAVALLLVAAVAAAVAFVQRGSARRSATSADAQRLGAQAVVQPRLDLSLLLARESVNLDNSPATQSELWATLLRSPAATYVFHVPEPFKGVLALSPDGRTLVVGSDEGIVTFYDARTHRELGSITPPGFRIHKSIVPVGALAFSHDGRLLAVGGWDRIAFLDPRTGQPSGLVAHVPGKGVGVVSRMAFSADDRTLAIGYPRYPGTGFYDSWIVGRVDVPARRAIPPAIDLSGRHPDHDDIDKVIYSPTGDVIASDWRAGKLVIFKQPGLRVRHTYTIPGVTSVAASPDGRTLGIAQDDGAVSIMSLPGGQMRLLGRHAPLGGVWSAQFTPDGRELVTTSADHTTIVWDVRSGTQLDVLTGQGDIIKQQAMSSDGRMLYTASEDGTVTAWDIGGAGRKLGRTLPFTAAYPADIYSNPQPTGVAVSPDGRLLALSQNGGLVRLWNLRTLTQVGAPFRGFKELDQSGTSGAEDMAFSPNGRLLAASGGAGSTVVVWDIRTHAVVHRFTPPNPSLAHGDGLEFSPDGKTLANGDGGNAALLWDLSTGSPQKLRLGNARSNRYALSLAYSPDGSRLATVDGLGLATLWDVARSPARRVISFPAEAAAGWATSVAFSPDGKLLATGSQGVITLRDAHTGRAVRTLRIPNGYNAVLAFSPSSSKLALLARDGAEVWNIATATQVGTALPGASPQAVTTGGPGNLRYTPDGQVVVVSPNGLASIWDVDPAAWSAAACGIAGRQLTRAEWERFVTTKPFARVCP
jgi:WD40 repeat protein